MCVICASQRGANQPTENDLIAMYRANPHGAGYMYARGGKVTIHKGFMCLSDYLSAIRAEEFTPDDVVVYHFRISTQAGVGETMTHPFPLTDDLDNTELLDLTCSCGIAHNGIIRATSDPNEKRYSDTALFIVRYLSHIIRGADDLRDPRTADLIDCIAKSKFAILGHDGYLLTVGSFTERDGNLYSNMSWDDDYYSAQSSLFRRLSGGNYRVVCKN